MLAGISITCFAASYAVALLLEVSRLFFRSGVRGAVMLFFGGAGVIAQTLFLGYRAATTPGPALSSPFDWYLIAAWVLAVMYLYLTIYHPKTTFGVFLLPLVLGLIGVAHYAADRQSFAESRAATIWGNIHAVFLLLGSLAVIVGFVGGAMALIQSYRLKHRLTVGESLRLPSLEWLERLNARAIWVSVVALSIGFLSGVVLNLITKRLDIEHVPWNDPIIWSSGLLLIWVVAAAAFSLLYMPARQGRKVAYLTVASFLFLVLTVAARLMLPSEHASGGQSSNSKVSRDAQRSGPATDTSSEAIR